MRGLRLSAFLLIGGISLLPGCRQAPAPSAQNAGPVRRYPITGKVVGTNAEANEVEVDAAAIPGFMGAMTMPYDLKDRSVLKTLHRGDVIQGTLDVDGNGTVLDEVSVTSRAGEVKNPTPQAELKPLVPGEPVPAFALLDQSDQTVNLAQYRGKVLLVTFVYTHCPLSDYCPRMSRNFAAIDKALAGKPALYAQTHLLSVSFDPKRDTPAVLRSYGGAYTGRYTQETFDHWTFAVPKPGDLTQVLGFFDVGAVPAPGGTLTHTLSTVAIGKDGRVLQWWTGNDWTVDEVLHTVDHALGASA